MQYKYQLEKYKGIKSRFICPSCGAKNSFTKYIDIVTQEYLGEDLGICNRKIKCGYHKTPKDYYKENNQTFNSYKQKIYYPVAKRDTSFVSVEEISKSLNNYQENNFIQFLYTNFEKSKVDRVAKLYKIGTHNHWKGATVLWQIDTNYKVRTGKIMLFDIETAKRVKKPFSHINWYHSLMIKQGAYSEFELSQCFFGEHLLKRNTTNNIGIVESEKTAIICSIVFPEMIWLASGGLSNINSEKVKILNNLNITMFPDNGAFDMWKIKADLFGFSISRLLEEKGSNGQDLADYLIAHQKSTMI